jgi:hypothetical protein
MASLPNKTLARNGPRGFSPGTAAFSSVGACHEEIPEIVLNSSRGDDRIRGFKRTHVRTRQGCRKHHELPGGTAMLGRVTTTGIKPLFLLKKVV